MIETPAIAVVFDVDRLGEDYPAGAWELFLPVVVPTHLKGANIRDGDTAETLTGRANHFCITVSGSEAAVRHVRETFTRLSLPELLAPAERLLEGDQLRYEPLPRRARVDRRGRLVTERWELQMHRLCVACRWPYRPGTIPDDLDPATRKEMAKLDEASAAWQRPPARPPDGAEPETPTPKTMDSEDERPPPGDQHDGGTRWWRFWKKQ